MTCTLFNDMSVGCCQFQNIVCEIEEVFFSVFYFVFIGFRMLSALHLSAQMDIPIALLIFLKNWKTNLVVAENKPLNVHAYWIKI